jgi:opacity protein-like surface antigen
MWPLSKFCETHGFAQPRVVAVFRFASACVRMIARVLLIYHTDPNSTIIGEVPLAYRIPHGLVVFCYQQVWSCLLLGVLPVVRCCFQWCSRVALGVVMKKLLLSTSVLVALGVAGSAMAADLPVYKAPPYVAPLADWSGFYIGVHGGYGWGHDPFTEVFFDPITLDGINSKGWLFGGHAGYNWQYGHIVTGLEVDLSWTDIQDSTSGSTNRRDRDNDRVQAASMHDRFDYLGSARARLGVLPMQDVLLYGTGGLAWTHFTQDMTASDVDGSRTRVLTASSTPSDRFGWVAGVGGEMTLARMGWSNWLARFEYLHYDFGSLATFSQRDPADVPSAPTSSGRLTADVVRGGLSFKFR